MTISLPHLLLSIILGLIIGAWTSYLAKFRGRDPKIWFILGFCFGLLGLIALLILPDLTKNENSEQEIVVEPEPVVIPTDLEEWYYLDNENLQQGPVKLADLKGLLAAGTLSSTTYVWKEGMEDWKTIEDCRL